MRAVPLADRFALYICRPPRLNLQHPHVGELRNLGIIVHHNSPTIPGERQGFRQRIGTGSRGANDRGAPNRRSIRERNWVVLVRASASPNPNAFGAAIWTADRWAMRFLQHLYVISVCLA
jgi:hypothetical protein